MRLKRTFSQLCVAFVSTTSFAQGSVADPAIACLNSLLDKPALNAVRDKIALVDARAQTLSMLSNEAKPKKTEKEAISVWVLETEKCVSASRQWHQEHYPASMLSLIDTYFATMKLRAADLYAGKITFGAFARDRAAMTTKLDADLVEIGQTIREQERQANEAAEIKTVQEKRHTEMAEARREEIESARRQEEDKFNRTMAEAERARMMNYFQNMNRNNAQSGYQVVQPPIMGRGSNCTSTVMGNVVSTNCRPSGLQIPW